MDPRVARVDYRTVQIWWLFGMSSLENWFSIAQVPYCWLAPHTTMESCRFHAPPNHDLILQSTCGTFCTLDQSLNSGPGVSAGHATFPKLRAIYWRRDLLVTAGEDEQGNHQCLTSYHGLPYLRSLHEGWAESASVWKSRLQDFSWSPCQWIINKQPQRKIYTS